MATKHSYRVIELTRGFVAVIDAEDFRRVNRWSWRVCISAGTKRKPGHPYARGKVNGKDVYLHRYIMNAPDRLQVDHKNHCTLDCRKGNMECVEPIVNNHRRRSVARRKS